MAWGTVRFCDHTNDVEYDRPRGAPPNSSGNPPTTLCVFLQVAKVDNWDLTNRWAKHRRCPVDENPTAAGADALRHRSREPTPLTNWSTGTKALVFALMSVGLFGLHP